jgi:hypothetical protein
MFAKSGFLSNFVTNYSSSLTFSNSKRFTRTYTISDHTPYKPTFLFSGCSQAVIGFWCKEIVCVVAGLWQTEMFPLVLHIRLGESSYLLGTNRAVNHFEESSPSTRQLALSIDTLVSNPWGKGLQLASGRLSSPKLFILLTFPPSSSTTLARTSHHTSCSSSWKLRRTWRYFMFILWTVVKQI